MILHGTDYDELKEVSDEIVAELTARDDVVNVHSSLENTAPVVAINVDQAAVAAEEGFTASQIGRQVKQMLDGEEADHPASTAQEISVHGRIPGR